MNLLYEKYEIRIGFKIINLNIVSYLWKQQSLALVVTAVIKTILLYEQDIYIWLNSTSNFKTYLKLTISLWWSKPHIILCEKLSAFWLMSTADKWNTGCPLNMVFFKRILESWPTLPRQHSIAIGCTKNYQQIRLTVHSHCVESFEDLLQRCRRGRGCS